MATIEVGESTKERLIVLGGASTPDETIRHLLEQAKRLEYYKAAIKTMDEWLAKCIKTIQNAAIQNVEGLMEELKKLHVFEASKLVEIATEKVKEEKV